MLCCTGGGVPGGARVINHARALRFGLGAQDWQCHGPPRNSCVTSMSTARHLPQNLSPTPVFFGFGVEEEAPPLEAGIGAEEEEVDRVAGSTSIAAAHAGPAASASAKPCCTPAITASRRRSAS